MSDESKGLRDAPAVAEAADWLARLEGGAAGGDDWLAFETWLAASPAHTAAYVRLEGLWVELDADCTAILEALDAAPAMALPRRARPSSASTPSRRAWLRAGWAVAASLAVAVAGLGYMRTRETVPVVYETANGETSQVTLADGTRIRLNGGSRISVRLDRGQRRVEMADAEATFDVAHDPSRPFRIAVGDREVRVVGTEFNLRRRSGRIALTVRRGVVDVRSS
ncbi:MAG: FecR domain-containing protein, partial [Phenylobacterium sp.]